ncbi:MAG: response regulator, partial [Bacteroidota bacterium]
NSGAWNVTAAKTICAKYQIPNTGHLKLKTYNYLDDRMILSNIKKYYISFMNLGTGVHIPKNELKKIKIFNGLCGLWYLLMILATIANINRERDGQFLNIPLDIGPVMNTANVAMITFLAFIQLLHYKRYFYTARLLLIISIMVFNFIIANYIDKGRFMECFIIAAPSISLIFIDSKRINYSILMVSYLCFALPNFYFKHYPIETFNNAQMSFLFFGIFIVINYFKTLNRNNEFALEMKTRELEDINRFQSRFFINISHEIRTPLTLIKGQTARLNAFSDVFSEAVEVRETLDRQVAKITKMVDDVIDLARMESSDFKLKLQPVSLTELTTRLSLAFEPLFQQKHIRFELKKRKKNYMVQADSVYLERALNNIVMNALKYTDKGGAVTIELSRKQQEVSLRISDTGIGISKADTNKIFNRFYQADNDINSAGGSGVGLAFSREIIAMHQGTLGVKSELNQGSSFTITLPLLEVLSGAVLPEHTIPVSEPKHPETSIPVKGRVFLIVDDNAEMRSYLKSILREHQCLEAENGLEALDIVKQQPIDLIITDYMMPKMNGLQFVAKLKTEDYQMPVLMLTARKDTESKLDVLRLGVDDYMTKPFEKEELLIRIQNALKHHTNRMHYIKQQGETVGAIDNEPPDWIRDVKNYIEQESANPDVKQVDIADYFNLSPSTLYRKIKGATGLSPNEFITEVKLQKARRIVENNPEILLKQLSLEVGYLNSYYFSKIYYKRFGRNPLSY